MTDKEIEKALELCMDMKNHCNDCLYNDKVCDCVGSLLTDTLDYINRLKSKIEVNLHG